MKVFKMMELIDQRKFAEKLLNWWRKNKRTYPWRNTKDPYRILISEILLHRTKADQVVPVYNKFIKRFETINELFQASVGDVKEVLYTLGLHWRSEYLHHMAKIIAEKYGGKIPLRKDELKSLPGISDYIASAVRCFAYGYPEILLDTNTVRILGRVFGIKVTDSSRRSRYFKELYQFLLDKKHPREFNYAMIDLGALICKSRKPLHEICPLRDMCAYVSENR